jgi:predicted transcriptional regulator
MTDNNDATLIEMTVEIVAAFVSGNALDAADLPSLITTVHGSLKSLGAAAAEPVAIKELIPAVPAKRSVFPDFIVCLEDGKRFKSLKRHLRSSYNMSPDEYRTKWGLPSDYPMVAPNYAAARSDLAKKIGLGRGRR